MGVFNKIVYRLKILGRYLEKAAEIDKKDYRYWYYEVQDNAPKEILCAKSALTQFLWGKWGIYNNNKILQEYKNERFVRYKPPEFSLKMLKKSKKSLLKLDKLLRSSIPSKYKQVKELEEDVDYDTKTKLVLIIQIEKLNEKVDWIMFYYEKNFNFLILDRAVNEKKTLINTIIETRDLFNELFSNLITNKYTKLF